MNERVAKKMLTPFEATNSTGAILMVNLFEPQIATTKLFLEAIQSRQLPYMIIGNKVDLVSTNDVGQVEADLGAPFKAVSFLKKESVADLADSVRKRFPAGSRITVLGVFNTGKTSLIAHLTGKPLKISNMPGTTLSFEPHEWEDRVLIDSVGQLIDVNRPFMVGYDFSGLDEPGQMFEHAMRLEAEGILSSVSTAKDGFLKAISEIQRRIERGGKIVVTGAGASALVAEEIAGQFYETGVMCFPVTNNMSQATPVSFAKGIGEEEGGLARFIAGCVPAEGVLIGVSASGGTGFVYESLRLAREKGVFTVAITENKDTPLGMNADVVIKSNAKPEGPSSTRIQTAHLSIGHALVCTLAALRGLAGEESVQYMLPEHIATKKMGIK